MHRIKSPLLALVLMVLGASVYSQSAKLVINELKANLAGDCDLVELRVIEGGSMSGIVLKERNDLVLTFTDFAVAQDDLIVVHFNGLDGTCNPNSSANETTAVDENLNIDFGANFDTAFDWYADDAGLVGTDNVISLLNPDASIMDAVFASDDDYSTDVDNNTAAATVAAAGEWQMPGGGTPGGAGFVNFDFRINSVMDLAGIESLQRHNNQDHNTNIDWTGNITTTFGALNVGQSLIAGDVTASTVTISSPFTGPVSTAAFDIVVTFDEQVFGFDGLGLIITNGTAGAVTDNLDNSYTVSITATAPETVVTFDYPANVVSDINGNLNLAAATFTMEYTNIAPVLDPIGPQTGTAGSIVYFQATATDANIDDSFYYTLGGATPGMQIDPLSGMFFWVPTDDDAVTNIHNVTVTVTDNGTVPMQHTEVVNITIEPVAGSGNIIYVDQANAGGTEDGLSWATAFTDLQAALAADSDGDQIWIAQGTYLPTTNGDRSIYFDINSRIALYGGFAGNETSSEQRNILANPTIISGDLDNDDVGGANNAENSYQLFGAFNAALFDGLIITGGNANGGATLNAGAALLADESKFIRIKNSWLLGNDAGCGSCGIIDVNNTDFSRLEVINTVFENNSSGTVINASGPFTGSNLTNVKIINSTFSNNNRILSAQRESIKVEAYNNIFDGNLNNNIVLKGAVLDFRFNIFSNNPNLSNYTVFENNLTNQTIDLDASLMPMPGSPAIGAGSNAYVDGTLYAPITSDLAGNARVSNGTIDMGAFEFINAAPVLENASPITMASINEDAANNGGDAVSALLTGLVTDLNNDPVGMAITSADNTNGSWQYSLDAGGAWSDIGNPVETEAFLISPGADSRLRFVPGNDFNGTINPGLTFRAWDGTSGVEGTTTADAGVNGDTTAFSTQSGIVDITVDPVNDAPVISPIGTKFAFETQLLAFLVQADDIEDDLLSYSATNGLGQTINQTGKFTWTPPVGSAGDHPITITVSDGQLSTDQSFTITVQPYVEGSPVVANSINTQITDEDSAYELDISGVFDDDGGVENLSYTATLLDDSQLPAWLDFTGTNFSGIPEQSDVGDYDIKLIATDAEGKEAPTTFVLSVKEVNDVPQLVGILENQTAAAGSFFSYTIPAPLFADEEQEESSLNISIILSNGNPLPLWLIFDNGTFLGTPGNADSGLIYTIIVKVTDAGGLSAQVQFTLFVDNAVTPGQPELSGSLIDQRVDEDQDLGPYTFPADLFIDPAGQTISYSAALSDGTPPDNIWLSFDASTRSFSGMPTVDSQAGPYFVIVTATNEDGLTAGAGFSIVVTAVNDVPVLSSTLETQPAIEDVAFEFTIPANTFEDEEDGTALTYTALLDNGTALDGVATWLAFNSPTLTFSGTPPTEEVTTVVVTATDSGGKSGESSFLIDVVTGLVEEMLSAAIDIYPNPVYQKFTVKIQSVRKGTFDLRLIDLSGKVLQSKKIELTEGSIEHDIDLNDLKSGIYLVEIAFGQERIIRRIVRK